jgi:hypothetical protein
MFYQRWRDGALRPLRHANLKLRFGAVSVNGIVTRDLKISAEST